MADIPIPPIPPRRAPLIDIMRELEARPRQRQSQEFDPVAAMAAERRVASRQPLPLPPIPPAVAPPRTAGDSAEAGPPRDLSSVSPTIRDRLPENNPYVAAAIDIAEKYNLPRDVFLSLVHQESRFDPKAKSPRGAFGLTQLMPGTARDLGVDPRDPMANLDAGARYLRQQIDRFGSLPLALAAYNSGPGRVIKSGNQIPNIRETQNYVSDILRNAGMEGTATDQRYGFAEGGRVGRVAGAIRRAVTREAPEATTLQRGVNPSNLIFREPVQNRLDEVANMFPEGGGYPPIVAAQTDDGLLILDGHNRAGVAQQRNETIDAVVIPESVYRQALSNGLDEVDISHAALELAGEGDAASAIRQQFRGTNWEKSEADARQFFDRYEDARQQTPSLEDLDRKYADGGAVSDEDAEYDSRLLSRMKAQMGRASEPTRAEQMQALRTAGRSAAEGLADVLLPQSPLDVALMVALGPGGRAARLAGSAALASLEPSEAEASRLRRLIRSSDVIERPLVAIHNTSPEKLERIGAKGDVAVAPSIAVTRADQPYDPFGSISLVAPASTVNPSRTPVYARDAYTPRYPRVETRTVRGEEREVLPVMNENTGEWRSISNTPENALRLMKKEPWRGGEDWITDNWLLGQLTPQFRTMTELKGARGRIVPPSDETAKNWLEELNNLRLEWANAANASGRRVDFDFYDILQRNLVEAMQRGESGMERINREYYGGSIPSDLLNRTRDFLKTGRDLPTTYFEAKPRRLVPLSEFEGAVIPANTPDEIRKILERNYIKDVLEYSSPQERTEQVGRLRHLFFSGAPLAAGSLAALDEKYAEGGTVRRPAAAPVSSPFDADYIERLAAQAVGVGEPVTEVRSAEGRGFAPMPRSFGEAGERMSAVIRGDVEPTPEEERQMNVVRGFTEGPASIRAYHGSPYAFERFDISKIGTGEGNQAYGRGLYFADKEAVARTYFDDMVGRKIIGGSKPDFNNPEHWAASLLDMNEGSRAAAIKDAKIHYGMTSPELISETVKLLRSKKPLPPMESSPGHMYEVRLRTTPEEMVNWNAPLVQQPERAIPFLEDVLRAPRTGSARVLEREMKPIGEAVDLRGPEVAAQLREAGIPGLRYLDAGSRSGGRGTRNYVMFGDDLIDITRRYAEGGLAALDEKYADGGTVRAPKETTIAGQDHKLAYITDREAALLKARGGSGRMTDYGVRAYNEGPGGEGPGGEGPGGDPSDNAGSMSDPSTQDAAGGNAGQGAGPTGAGAGPTGEQGPGPTGEDTSGEETSVTAPTTAPTTGAFGQFGAATGLGVVGGLAGLGLGAPGLGTIGSAIGAALDSAKANEQLGMMGLNQTVDRDTAIANAVSMGLMGTSVANQFGQALGFDALAEAPMSAFSTPDPLGDIAASQMDSGGSQYEQTEYGTPGLSNIATSMTPATAASLVDWNQIQREASALNMSVSDYLAMKWRSPAMMARGGMASLEQMHAKYAEGGPVVSVYDQDEINDLANQILEGAYV